MWLWGCDFHLFVPAYNNLALSDPPTQVVHMNYSVLPPLLFFSQAWEERPRFESFIINIRPSALTNCQLTGNLHPTCISGGSAHTSWPATTLTTCIKVILPDCFRDLTLPMEILLCHIPDRSGMPRIPQSTEWSQPCLVDTLCARSLKLTLHIDHTAGGNAAQYGGVERINWHPVPSQWLTSWRAIWSAIFAKTTLSVLPLEMPI